MPLPLNDKKKSTKWYPLVILITLMALAALARFAWENGDLTTTIFENKDHENIRLSWVAAASWFFIFARGIAFLSYLARLKDYWHKKEYRYEKVGIIISIILTIALVIALFSCHISFFHFNSLASIGSGLLFSFFLGSQFVGLLPRLLRSLDGSTENKLTTSFNLKNENLAIVGAIIVAIIFIIVVTIATNGVVAFSLYDCHSMVLTSICSLYALCSMIVSSASYIGRFLDLFSTTTLLDLLQGNQTKTAKREQNAESFGMILGMFLGPAIGSLLIWGAAISVPLSGGLSAPLAIILFLFGNIGLGGSFGARLGAVYQSFFSAPLSTLVIDNIPSATQKATTNADHSEQSWEKTKTPMLHGVQQSILAAPLENHRIHQADISITNRPASEFKINKQ